jgi:glycosyltransferase involved in cell wall biosynthesis
MTDEIMVSVLCTAYNHEKYIRDALEGFVMQKTTFPFEVLVHDDASTDHTADIIREYEAKYPDIIKPIYQSENQYSQGIKIYQNYLYPRVHGKYIAFCEGDDYWTDENKLQMQVDYLEAHPECPACVHNTILKDIMKKKETVWHSCEERDLVLSDVVTGDHIYHTSSLVYRSECLRNRPPFLYAIDGVGDYPKRIDLTLRGPIHYFGKVMSVYRYGTEGSWTRGMINDGGKRKLKLCEQSVKMLEMANQFSNYRYDDIFQLAINEKKYALNIAKGNFRAVLTHSCFRQSSLKDKAKTIIKMLFPFYGKIKILLYRIGK